MKKWGLLLSLLIFLSGCSMIDGENELTQKINDIELILNEPNWKQLMVLSNELEELYIGNEWKIQLMGDEDEYESLEESINLLIVAIEEQDLTETKLELSTVKTLLNHIYSW